MSENSKIYLTDDEIIRNAKFIPVGLFLTSNQTQARVDTVISILATGNNVAIVYWPDGTKGYIPLPANVDSPSDVALTSAYKSFHEFKSKNPDLRGRVWVKI